MRLGPLALIVIGALAASSAELHPVLGVPDAEHAVIDFHGLPVTVGLAHLDVPETQRQRCRERVREITRAHKAEVRWTADYGVDTAGAAKVHLVVDGEDVARTLIAAGVARYQPGAKRIASVEDPLRAAQEQAQKQHVGVWGATATAAATAAETIDAGEPAASTVASRAPAPAAAAAKAIVRGPFCSELDSPFYQASDDPAVADVAPARLIFYADESAAERAGKKRRQDATAALPAGEDEATADAIFAKGKEVYTRAIAAGNSDARDQLYEQSFQILSKATLIYGALVDQRGDDEALAEKLRLCMQLRYGSMKQRRVH